MRIFFKIFLFPVTLILTIIVAIPMFLIERCAMILNIFSGALFLGALAAYLRYFFGWPIGIAGEASTLQLAIFATVFAFILSPSGLPLLMMWIIDRLDDLNIAIKSI